MSRPSQEVINRSRRKIYKFQQFALHRELDKDVIDKLDNLQGESKPAYIKRLIRKDMEQS